MKKIKLILALLLLMGVAQNIHAGGESGELEKTIRKSVSYPDFAKSEKMHGLVLVKYEVLENGSVKVYDMNASHPDLGQYVQERLERLVFSDASATGVHYAKFNFKFLTN
jgi:hypothetical protein